MYMYVHVSVCVCICMYVCISIYCFLYVYLLLLDSQLVCFFLGQTLSHTFSIPQFPVVLFVGLRPSGLLFPVHVSTLFLQLSYIDQINSHFAEAPELIGVAKAEQSCHSSLLSYVHGERSKEYQKLDKLYQNTPHQQLSVKCDSGRL